MTTKKPNFKTADTIYSGMKNINRNICTEIGICNQFDVWPIEKYCNPVAVQASITKESPAEREMPPGN